MVVNFLFHNSTDTENVFAENKIFDQEMWIYKIPKRRISTYCMGSIAINQYTHSQRVLHFELCG